MNSGLQGRRVRSLNQRVGDTNSNIAKPQPPASNLEPILKTKSLITRKNSSREEAGVEAKFQG